MENIVTPLKATVDRRKLAAEAHRLAHWLDLLANGCDYMVETKKLWIIEENAEIVEKLATIKRDLQDDAWMLRSATLSHVFESSLPSIIAAKRDKAFRTRQFLDKMHERVKWRKGLAKRREERARLREDK